MNHIPLTEVLNVTVCSERDGVVFAPVPVRDMIDYTDDQERCLLSQGKWYQYNDDYLSYLQASISEITTYYELQYDFSEEKYKAFIETKLLAERTEPQYLGKSDKEIREQLQKKYYAERVLTFLWSGIMDLKTMIAVQFLLATERLKSWISTRKRQCLRSKLAAHRESCAMLLTNHWKL